MINWVLYILLLLGMVAGVAASPRTVLLLAAFFPPLTQVLPSPLGPIGAASNLVLLGLLLVWLKVGSAGEHGPIPLRGVIGAMAFFILVGAGHRAYLELGLEQQFRNELDEVLRMAKEWVMGFGAYILVYRLVDSRRTAMRMWHVALVCAGGEVVLAVYERLQGIGRATAHLEEPNRAGAYFAAAAALLLAEALMARGILRWAAAGGCLMACAAVFASLSRGALLAAACGILVVLAVFFLFVRAGMRKVGVIALLLLVAINGAILVPQRVKDRIVFTFTGSSAPLAEGRSQGFDTSSEQRLELWRLSLTLMKEQPLGIGLDSFSTEAGRRLNMSKVAHNVYLQVGSELGVGALIVLLLLVGSAAWRCWRVFRTALEPATATISMGLLGAWTALAVAACFINPLLAFNLSGQFWIVLAAASRAAMFDLQTGNEAAAGSAGRPGARLAAAAARR